VTPTLRFPQVIDNTIREDWVLCRHRCFRRHFQGLTVEAGKSVHLHFGGCFARGLEVTRNAFWRDDATASSAVHRGILAAITEWGDYEHEPRSKSEEVKSLPALVDALASYFEHYPLGHEAVRPVVINGLPLVERSFAVPIPGSRHPDTGEPILYAGRCDLVGHVAEGIWIVDEKTSTRLGDGWAEKWDLDGQPTGYVWGFRSYGLNPIGAIMRGVGIYTKDIGFAESIQPRSTWKVDQWLRQLQHDVHEMCQAYTSYLSINHMPDVEGYWFGRDLSDACHAFNKPCMFKPLCDTPEPSRWFDSYVTDYWDPLTLRDGDAQ